MNKVLLLVFFLKLSLFSCDICIYTTPKTQVQINVNSSDKKILSIDFLWLVSKEFTTSLNDIYDQNLNGKLDKDEIIDIEDAFLSYVENKNYLTNISYSHTNTKTSAHNNEIIKSLVYIKDERLHLSYSIKYIEFIKNEYNLEIEVKDENNYFDLMINHKKSYFSNFKVIDESSVSKIVFQTKKTSVSKKENVDKKIKKDIPENIKRETYISKYSKYIKENLLKIKNEKDYYSLFILLFVSFIYGIIHAIGPGHGKTLAFSYFLINKTSTKKAFLISFLTSFIHIIGAFILVMISVFILDTLLSSFVNDSIVILTKLSAVLIILLALFILYKKVRNKKCPCSSCSVKKDINFQNMKWREKEKKKSSKQELYFVLTAGLIPCPGTVVLFLYAFILKTYFAVILASIAISLGMALVIFCSSFLGLKVKVFSKNSHILSNIIEYFAILFMMILALLLFLNAGYL